SLHDALPIWDAVQNIFRISGGCEPYSTRTRAAERRFRISRESGGTADAPDLGSGARKGVGVRLSPLAPPLTCDASRENVPRRTSLPRPKGLLAHACSQRYPARVLHESFDVSVRQRRADAGWERSP